jgi:ATP-dependent DNA helicase RecG
MTRDELIQIIAEVQKHKSEFDEVEVKAARGGTPRRLFAPLSAFSNQSGGGVILLGLDEERGFDLAGVRSVQKLINDISDMSASEMEPSLRPEFTVEEINGKTVVAVEIDEIPVEQKPCYYKPAGLQKGSYIRVGNTNRQMTDYEIFGYVSYHRQANYDEEVISDATIEDLDHTRLESYLEGLRRTRPQANYLNLPYEQILKQLRIVRDVGSILRPTLSGLLVFGKYPQSFKPQLVITFLQYYGTTDMEKTPRGERFLDNRKFEGTIPEMVENAVNYVMAGIRKSSLIEGLWRRDIPEYPEEALREAVVNAIAHRDYSHFVSGSYVQIRLYADRLEIQSPGGLYGNVTVETLEEEQSTRNSLLMKFMEDLHLVENRGSGIRAMIMAMRKANLEPPRFQDKRSSFWVTLRNHTLMSPDAVAWLNQFFDQPMNDQQRVALVYLRNNRRITNSDYQRLNHVDSVTANRDLRRLVQSGLIEQNGTRRWAYYTLRKSNDVEVLELKLTNEEKVLAYIRENGSISRSECQKLLNVTTIQARYILQKMRNKGLLKLVGSRRGSRYIST